MSAEREKFRKNASALGPLPYLFQNIAVIRDTINRFGNCRIIR